jgi:predicted porin
MVNAVVKDHPFYGQTAVIQAGAVATLLASIDGGLELSPQQIELTLGYQFTNRQNLRLNYHNFSDSDAPDKVWLEYNYAF